MESSNRKLIGLTGFARSGKDTVGARISERSGIQTYALASPIKKCVNTLFRWDERHSDGELKEVPQSVYNTTQEDVRDFTLITGAYLMDFMPEPFNNTMHLIRTLADAMDENYMISPRRAYQVFGTEGGREIDENLWLKVAEQELIRLGGLIITDIRFPNEADWIHQQGGTLIKVVRDDAAPVSKHSSEQGIPDDLCDIVLENNGTLGDLYDLVDFTVFDGLKPIL